MDEVEQSKRIFGATIGVGIGLLICSTGVVMISLWLRWFPPFYAIPIVCGVLGWSFGPTFRKRGVYVEVSVALALVLWSGAVYGPYAIQSYRFDYILDKKIPIYPSAELYSYTKRIVGEDTTPGFSASYRTSASLTEIKNFFREYFTEHGWQEDHLPDGIYPGGEALRFISRSTRIRLSISDDGRYEIGYDDR